MHEIIDRITPQRNMQRQIHLHSINAHSSWSGYKNVIYLVQLGQEIQDLENVKIYTDNGVKSQVGSPILFSYWIYVCILGVNV